jgi:DNA invertase Pin-like site-specific DNA recombinase
MLIGYARISTHDQTSALQQDALQRAGCNKIFTDTASGAKAERKGLEEALEFLRAGGHVSGLETRPVGALPPPSHC